MSATQGETRLTQKCIGEVKKRGGWAVKVHGTGYSSGQPDLDGCLHGRSIKVEVKVPGKKPTGLQMATLRKWEAAGALAGWVTSVAELADLLEHVDDAAWRNPQLASGA